MGADSLRLKLSESDTYSKSLIMGVVNATPDSFSDGGQFSTLDNAIEHALALVDQGADILDIGGESTRPGAEKVILEKELERVIPLIDELRKFTDIPISIDTYKPEVMLAAVKSGASMINDVNGLRADGAVDAAVETGVPVCIMHMQGDPSSMQIKPSYANVVEEVLDFFRQRIDSLVGAGMERRDIIVDPGIGFGKTLNHNLQLLSQVETLKLETQCEVLIGVSRKSLIDKLLGRPVDQRLPASLGLAVQSVLNGAKIVRVHDVRETFDAVRAVEAVRNST